MGTNYACLGLRWATWAGRRGQRGLHFYNPGGHVGCILRLSWLTLGHMGGPSWAKRVTFLGTAPTLGYKGGPSWPKRGCISRHRAWSRWACWVHIGRVLAYVGPHGRAVVAQDGCISRHRAWSRWACLIHIGLVLAYVGPHGRAVVAQEGCISRHCAWSRWACLIHIGLVLAYVGPHGRGGRGPRGLHF